MNEKKSIFFFIKIMTINTVDTKKDKLIELFKKKKAEE